MRRIVFLSILPLVVLSLFCCSIEAKSSEGVKQESISETEILPLLEKFHKGNGKCSDVSVDTVYVEKFIESGDYGPMWYGDTIVVKKTCFSIKYKFDKIDNSVDKSKGIFRSNDWHSNEEILIALDGSISFRRYTCRFGGVPPSHGYANRKIDFDKNIKALFTLLCREKK